jgi:outer membrane protein assembly factor BamB
MPTPTRFISSARRHHRRWPYVIGGLLVLGAGAAVAAYLIFFQKEGNYSNPNAAFQSQPAAPPVKKKPKPETFKWPIYGYTPTRTRYLDAGGLHPPFKKLWTFHKGHGLIEFQPVLANGVLYYVNNGGEAFAVNAKTGKLRWRRKVGSLNASSPAWNKNRLYIVALSGNITCLNAKNGKLIWKKKLPSRAESSPIVVGGVVYFGSEDGTVYAYRASNGGKVWTYHAAGAVKAGLAYSNGNLYFGDYSGEVTALRASNGSRVWGTGTSGASFNRSGQFYSTPAVAFGRVYLGNTDGLVYSFVAKSGQLAWRHSTGNYVYAAPAVASVPRLGPAVFIGSYDGHFYALDAKSGGVRWSYNDGGKISGAPTIVGDIVYYSSLGNKNSSGLDVRTGRRVWKWPNGAFNPVISDGKRIYLTTYSTLYGLIPKPRKSAKQKAPAAKKRSQPRSKSK